MTKKVEPYTQEELANLVASGGDGWIRHFEEAGQSSTLVELLRRLLATAQAGIARDVTDENVERAHYVYSSTYDAALHATGAQLNKSEKIALLAALEDFVSRTTPTGRRAPNGESDA